MDKQKENPKFIVIGAGVAGLNCALKLSQLGKVLILNKGSKDTNASNWAQGGIAAKISKKDSLEKYFQDTISTGCNHNKKKAVEVLIIESSKVIDELESYGAQFNKDKKGLILTREAGHSLNRIVHFEDNSGREIMRALWSQIRGNKNIEIIHGAFVKDLIKESNICKGVEVIIKNELVKIFSSFTIICSGGSGFLYKHTTNPRLATGDAIAIAKRAGLKMNDLEFIQFHPTTLNVPNQKKAFLLSETLRGEGAVLINKKGERFMKKHSKEAELSPRHLVARYSYQETKKGSIYLKFIGKDKKELKERFPTIYKKLEEYGFNLEKDEIPTIPGAHYQCGGIETNLKGETSLKNCFAAGEAAYTGVHGANRLASNSLLEGIVFSNLIAKHLGAIEPTSTPREEEKTNNTVAKKISLPTTLEKKYIQKHRSKLRQGMWDNVGIIRKMDGLKKQLTIIKTIREETKDFKISKEYLELQNMTIAAEEITKAAIKRKESLGTHFIQN